MWDKIDETFRLVIYSIAFPEWSNGLSYMVNLSRHSGIDEIELLFEYEPKPRILMTPQPMAVLGGRGRPRNDSVIIITEPTPSSSSSSYVEFEPISFQDDLEIENSEASSSTTTTTPVSQILTRPTMERKEICHDNDNDEEDEDLDKQITFLNDLADKLSGLVNENVILSVRRSVKSLKSKRDLVDRTMCSICFSYVKNHVLLCGHMFCEGCLRKNPTMRCPNCRERYSFAKGCTPRKPRYSMIF